MTSFSDKKKTHPNRRFRLIRFIFIKFITKVKNIDSAPRCSYNVSFRNEQRPETIFGLKTRVQSIARRSAGREGGGGPRNASDFWPLLGNSPGETRDPPHSNSLPPTRDFQSARHCARRLRSRSVVLVNVLAHHRRLTYDELTFAPFRIVLVASS